MWKPWAGQPAIFSILGIFSILSYAHPMNVDVVFYNEGRSAQVRVTHVPAVEPLAALKLRLVFKPGAGAQSLTNIRPAAGPWSQFLPQARFANGKVVVWAMAPASGDGGYDLPRQVAFFDLALSPAQPLASAADLIDSVVVEEAYGPQGQKLSLARDMTTGLKPARVPAAAPVERVRGASRTLSFTLGRAQRVRAYVTDVRGKRVADVVDRKLPAGLQEVTWDGMARGGRPLAGGTYLLHLEAGLFTYDRKVEVTP